MKLLHFWKLLIMKQKMNLTSLGEVTDKYIGKPGTSERERFEHELRLDFLGGAIREARMKRNLTQEQLGDLVGVKRAQISKLENSLKDARINTISKVFSALGIKVNFNLEYLD